MTTSNQQLTLETIINAIDSKTWLKVEYMDGMKSLALFKSLEYPCHVKGGFKVVLDVAVPSIMFSAKDIEEVLILKDWKFSFATAADLKALQK
jgi:hypothetical protein